jgi:hypothetical protein
LHDGGVLQVFKDKLQQCVWFPTVADAHARYRLRSAPATGTSYRKNNRLCCDASKGEFYLFDLQHAIQVLRLLVENSFVQFGGRFYKQTCGIPMGINPAVYMANFYLNFYELQFVKQLADLYSDACLHSCQPSPNPEDWDYQGIRVLLEQLTPQPPQHLTVAAAQEFVTVVWELKGQAALCLLHHFRCTVRFVDDLTSGCNPFLRKLLYVREMLMDGAIHGIYPGCPAGETPGPGEFLVLEHTPPSHLMSFCTLDVEIASYVKQVRCPAEDCWLVFSSTRLNDKRQDPCYRGIPIVRYARVSSAISPCAGYNILVSQLHRFQTLITRRSSFVMEVAKLLLSMHSQGYCSSVLRKKLHRHLNHFLLLYG